MDQMISELYSFVPKAENENPEVSEATVGWHIQHCLLVIIKSVKSLSQSDPTAYRADFNWKRWLIFAIQRLPRGKGKAPDIVKPDIQCFADYEAMFDRTRIALDQLKQSGPRHFFKHPIFGNLNKKHTIAFMEIHTNHHLKIIKDIISS